MSTPPHTCSLAAAACMAAAAALSGCSAVTKKKEPPPFPPPGYMLEQAIPMESTASIRRAEQVKAYPVSRYIDPANPNVMHERHVIYRVEQPQRWRITEPSGAPLASKTLLGTVAGVREPHYIPSPLGQEIGVEVGRIKEERAKVQEAIRRSEQVSDATLALTRAANDNLRSIAEENRALKERLDDLERKLAELSVRQPQPAEQPSAPPAPQAADF